MGVAEDDLGPVRLDLLGEDPNLLVFGDCGSGKTTVLRTILGQLVAAHLDHELVITVVDPRRRLLDTVPEDYLGAYAPNATAAAGLAQSLAAELRVRQPASTDPVELARHTWHGPRIVCLVDDADLVVGMPSANPLAPLLEFLPAGPDLGFHLLLTRHAGGAARALFEPTLQRVKELGAPALLLSGDKEEGQLWPGATMRARPPGRGLLVRRGRAPRLVQVALPE
ncbi:MAG: AAA family ATPase [Dermatophilaceae bacterium]